MRINRRRIYLTGLEAARFLQISTFAVKSLKAKPPAEYITPSHLNSNIIIGSTIETETFTERIPIGFRKENLKQGIAILGGTDEERILTSLRILLEAAKTGLRFLIITRNPRYRIISNWVPQTKIYTLGRNLILNPLDPEDFNPPEYQPLLITVFTQILELSDEIWIVLEQALQQVYENPNPSLFELQEVISQIPETRVYGKKVLEALNHMLQLFTTGEIASMLGSQQNLKFSEILAQPSIIEIPTRFPLATIFIKTLILAKIIASKTLNQTLILLDDCEDIFHVDFRAKHRTLEKDILIEWLREITQKEAYIILSTGRIIETSPSALRFPKNRIVHRLTTVDERQIAANLLGLQEHASGIHSQKRRHRLYQITYLSHLEFGEAIFLREDYAYPFTIKINYNNLYLPYINEETHPMLPNLTEEIFVSKDRRKPKLLLHFGSEASLAAEILSIIKEYRGLTRFALANILRIDSGKCYLLLDFLEDQNYVRRVEVPKGKYWTVGYEITQRGETALKEYLEWKQSQNQQRRGGINDM